MSLAAAAALSVAAALFLDRQATRSGPGSSPESGVTSEHWCDRGVSESKGNNGLLLFDVYCGACHRHGIGRSPRGLWGSEYSLADGSRVNVDEAFIRLKISNPELLLPAGAAVSGMPAYPSDLLSSSDVAAIVSYYRSVGS